MQGTKIVKSFHLHGTLAANAVITFTAEADMHLAYVSACASNNSDATLMAGISTDTNSILAAAVIGDSGTPVEKVVSDFAAANDTGKVAKGEIFVATLDFDGAAGTAAVDVTLIFTFTEG